MSWGAGPGDERCCGSHLLGGTEEVAQLARKEEEGAG
jgi:hypothetical protein